MPDAWPFRPLLVGLGVSARRAVGLGVELEVHGAGRLPRVQQRFALVEPVLVFHALARRDRERHRLLLEGAVLRRDDCTWPAPAAVAASSASTCLPVDAELEEPEPRAGAQRIDAVLGRQDEHHEKQARGQQRRSSRDGESLSPGLESPVRVLVWES